MMGSGLMIDRRSRAGRVLKAAAVGVSATICPFFFLLEVFVR
jgi:hypothetical protein